MSATVAERKAAPGKAPAKQPDTKDAWRGFQPGLWQRDINVRWFLQRNYTPYGGDGAFLQGATQRTRALWSKLQPLLAQEREKGIVDVSQVPSGILAHAPGYINRDLELIVGLQTDAPLKRAVFPNGGYRVIAKTLETYGYGVDRQLEETFTKHRKTHNDGVLDVYPSDVLEARAKEVYRVARDPRFAQSWDVYPFNSGYFMLIKIKGVDAGKLREHLLDKHATGLISTSATDLRVAFSCLEVNQVEPLFEIVHAAIQELRS